MIPTLHLPHGSIVLISGPSGSGKSKMMAEIIAQFHEPSRIARPMLTDEKPVIENHRGDQRNWLDLLTMIGLADPWSWCRLPSELSEGQRLRLQIASMIESGNDIVVYDEFLATLDRITARAVAYSIGNTLRRKGIGALFVTSADDLVHDLRPDVHIKTRWQAEPEVSEEIPAAPYPSFMPRVTYAKGERRDWLALKSLHYAGDDPATYHSIHKLTHPDLAHPAAVCIYSYPDLHSAARNLATDDRYQIKGDPQRARILNREVVKLSRIVVAPEMRSCGLARKLILRSIETLNVRYVECVTAMGHFSPFLSNIGFQEVPQTSSPIEAELCEFVDNNDMPPHVALDPERFAVWLETLSVRKRREGRRICWHYFHHFALHRRTRKQRRKVVPGPNDARWPEAFALAAKRCRDRPKYYIYGPLEVTNARDQPSPQVDRGRANTPNAHHAGT